MKLACTICGCKKVTVTMELTAELDTNCYTEHGNLSPEIGFDETMIVCTSCGNSWTDDQFLAENSYRLERSTELLKKLEKIITSEDYNDLSISKIVKDFLQKLQTE